MAYRDRLGVLFYPKGQLLKVRTEILNERNIDAEVHNQVIVASSAVTLQTADMYLDLALELQKLQ